MERLPLSIVIVTWNGLRHLPACLAALLPQLPPDGEVLLVDNGSTDGTVAWVRATHPDVELLALTTNLGFAGGVNAGLRAARGELLLLLNDDAFVEAGFVAALLAIMKRYPHFGAAGGVLTFAHQPAIVASGGIQIQRNGLALDLWAGMPVSALPADPVEIAGPSGGAALYRRALLEDVGLLEPEFGSYLEDVDLAWRALLRGWRSVVVPGARARHVYSATGGQGSVFKQRLLARNRLRVIARCMPGPLLLRCLPAILAYDLMAVAYGLLARKPAIASGRLEALRELPALIRQRRTIQARRRVPLAALERWLAPAAPWAALREQRRLEAILAERVP